jgi:catechol 2,3-dioxygenase-like lactoylglutathione lyase family enzyme
MNTRRHAAVAVELDHVVIAVTDWARSNAFYRDVLRAELVPLLAGARFPAPEPSESPYVRYVETP